MISWGIALMCNAAVKNKGGLFTTRFLLGLVRFFVTMWHNFKKQSICEFNTYTSIGRGWTVSRCHSPNDLLVSPRRNVFTAALLLWVTYDLFSNCLLLTHYL
jgi:hypothetical protein